LQTEANKLTSGSIYLWTNILDVYAGWKANNYIVTLRPMNGTVDGKPFITVPAVYDELLSLPDAVPVGVGLTFFGWWTSESGEGERIPKEALYKTTGDSEYFARYVDTGSFVLTPGVGVTLTNSDYSYSYDTSTGFETLTILTSSLVQISMKEGITTIYGAVRFDPSSYSGSPMPTTTSVTLSGLKLNVSAPAVDNTSPLIVRSGAANVYLDKNNSFTVDPSVRAAALFVQLNATLNLGERSSGYLYAKAGAVGAGIGAGYGSAGGSISILGGNIEAIGGSGGGAGIGAGGGINSYVTGDITISGGGVTATGGSLGGAGIGGGYGGNSSVRGDITINGGDVIAAGSSSGGAGIGGGKRRK
jgi:hypothetical protein